MLQYKTISPATLELLRALQRIDYLKEMRLVGGTALALQTGHRISVDLDLFGLLNVDTLDLNPELSKMGTLQQIKDTKRLY